MTGGRNFHNIRSNLKTFFASGLQKFDLMSLEQLDAVLNLYPEMALPKVAIGTCLQDMTSNKKMTAIGHYNKDGDMKSGLHVSACNTDFVSVKGVSLETKNGDFEMATLEKVRPLLDRSSENC